MRRALIRLAAALAALCATPAQAAGPYENTTAGTISNASHPCTGTARFTRTITVADSFIISDLDVGLTITHAWRLDLQLTLSKAGGPSVVIVNDGDTGAVRYRNYNLRLDDEASPTVNTGSHQGDDALTPAFDSRVAPDNPLSAFDGLDAQGTWTLSACDTFAQDDGGFTALELIFEGQASSQPPDLSCGPAGLVTFDWNANAWPSGSLQQSYSIGDEDMRVTVGGSTGNLLNDPGQSVPTPVTSTYYTGGLGAAEESLFLLANHANAGQSLSLTIDVGDLSAAQNPGVDELQFRLFDIDFGANQFEDQLTVTGVAPGGGTVLPILNASGANTVSGNQATGTVAAAADSATGTVHVTFVSPVTQVTVIYGNGPNVPANPGNQGIALNDVSICPRTLAMLAGDKTTRTATGGHALPGTDVIYDITVTNEGTGATDPDSLFLVDRLPPEVAFRRGAAGSEAVTFTETGTGLTYAYATDIGYATGTTAPTGMAQCTYAPQPGYDPAVTFVCFNPKGAMAAGDPDPTFTFSFRARIK